MNRTCYLTLYFLPKISKFDINGIRIILQYTYQHSQNKYNSISIQDIAHIITTTYLGYALSKAGYYNFNKEFKQCKTKPTTHLATTLYSTKLPYKRNKQIYRNDFTTRITSSSGTVFPSRIPHYTYARVQLLLDYYNEGLL